MTDTPQTLERPDGTVLAYHKTQGRGPGIVFLSGYMSDMSGSKASFLERHCLDHGRAYLRFDYRGHGLSSGAFTDGTIGAWAGDAVAMLDQVVEGPQVLVGSSMGGWLMLLAALARPQRVAGLLGIAAAPDFTETLMWESFSPEVKETLRSDGVYREPSPYGEEPYTITRRLIEEGRDHLLLHRPIALDCPVRLIHGMADPNVPYAFSLRLAERLTSNDVEIQLVKRGDHRLSGEADLRRLAATLEALCAVVEAAPAQ